MIIGEVYVDFGGPAGGSVTLTGAELQLTRRTFLSCNSTLYNIGARIRLNSRSGPACPKTSFSLILIKYTFSQWILTFLTFTKILLKNHNFTFVTRLRPNLRGALFLSHVCSRFDVLVFAFSFAFIYQPQCACQSLCPKSVFVLKRNVL